jgi:type I restriction enzyme S subunit
MQEQACAVSLADSLYDAARVVQAQIKAETDINASRLRQSILKCAFEGGLVPQDPADEPASVLLERIRAEREEKRKRDNRRRAKPRRQPKSRVP